MRKYLLKFIIIPIIICGLVFPSTLLASFEAQEKNKYRLSLYGQVFAPPVVVGTVKAFENLIRKKYAPHLEDYKGAKRKFFELFLGQNPKGFKFVNTAVGYGTFWQAMNASFVGLVKAMNIPATLGWISAQMLTQENRWLSPLLRKKMGLNPEKGFYEMLIPDELPTFDFNLKENAKISAYVKNGKIQVQESIWSTQKGFITNTHYSSDGLSATITVDNFGLKMFENESNEITISLRNGHKSTAKNVTLEDFIIKNGGNTWRGADNATKASPMIWDIGINAGGRQPIYNKLKFMTGFLYEDGGRGYDVAFHTLADKITRVGVGTSFAFAMGEVFRQVTHFMFNFTVHALTSFDMLLTFMFSGIVGKATGSRLVDAAYLTGVKIDRFLMRKFPKLQAKFPYRKNIDEINHCLGFFQYIIRPPIRGRTDLNMKLVQHMLMNRYGRVYKYGTLVLAAEIGTQLAYGVPRGWSNLKKYLLDVFHPLGEDPDAPYDLSGFPPIGADDHALTGDEGIDTEIAPDQTVMEHFANTLKSSAPAHALAAHANIANIEQAYNEDNGINGSQIKMDRNTLGELYDMQADSVTSTLAEYEKNPEAFKELLWLSFLMTAPVKMLQESYIEKVNIAMDTDKPEDEVKKVFFSFMDEIGLSYAKRDVYKAFEEEFEQSGGMLKHEYVAEKIVSFIALSDVVYFARGYEQMQLDNVDVLDNEGGQ